MKQIKVRQTWHHESSVSSLSRFMMGNVSSITSLKRIPIDVLFRPARRPEYTVYSSPHFQVQRSTNLPSDFHFNSHSKACKRLRLPFHYWPINSTISGSVTSIWKPSKSASFCGLCVWAASTVPDWLIVICVRWCPSFCFCEKHKGKNSEACTDFLKRKTSSTRSGFILGLSRGTLRLFRCLPD